MSIPALNWCIEQKALPPGEWVVLFHLCHAHNAEHGCFPSQDFLAEQTNMSKRSIVRHIGALEEAGLVVRKRRFNAAGERISDRYFMPFEPGFARENQPSANLASGQSVHDQVPNGARNVHEMAPKHEVTGIEQEEPPCIPPAEISAPVDKPEPKARLPADWALSDEGWAYARSQQIPDEAIRDEATGFHAYWADRRDRDASKSQRGWEQCWAGWCRRIAPRYARHAGRSGPHDALLAGFQRSAMRQ